METNAVLEGRANTKNDSSNTNTPCFMGIPTELRVDIYSILAGRAKQKSPYIRVTRSLARDRKRGKNLVAVLSMADFDLFGLPDNVRFSIYEFVALETVFTC